MNHGRRRLAHLFVAASALLALARIAQVASGLPAGLAGTHYDNPDWREPAIHTTLDAPPSTFALAAAWHDQRPPASSAVWRGSLLILRGGPYTFATTSDDGSWLLIDDRVIVDNGGAHVRRLATGTTPLSAGVHRIALRYFDDGGDSWLDLLWAQAAEPLSPIPAWHLRPRVRSASTVVAAAATDAVEMTLAWIWVALGWGVVAAWIWRRCRARLARVTASWHPAMRWVLIASIAANLAGIAWGLPAAWAPDELSPPGVLDGFARAFSGDWFDRYPPLHYAVLGIAELPVLVLRALGAVALHDGVGLVLLWIAGRLVSVAMAAGILVALERVAHELFGRRTSMLAVALTAIGLPFVYYARTANVDVPYIFWFSLALVCYVRALTRGESRDLIGLTIVAAAAACTKDQAYGLFVLMPLPIVLAAWRRRRPGDGSFSEFGRHASLALLAGVAAVVVGQNVVFDWHGFVHHLELLAGPASQTYQAFPRTMAGHVALEYTTVRLVVQSMGAPAAVTAVAGLALSLVQRATRLPALWLITPVVSYDLTFLHVVLYNYDRFVLPICLIGAIFGGVALDRLIAVWGATGRALTAVVVAHGAVAVIALDLLTIGDSRYAVRRWLQSHETPNDRLAIAQPAVYLPRVDDFDPHDLYSVSDLATQTPDVVVWNEDYARASPDDPIAVALARGLADGSLGYRLAFRARTPAPFPWLPAQSSDLVGPRTTFPVTSILRDVNPTIAVFERAPRSSRAR